MRGPCASDRGRATGFSLLEVLVAFVILALVGTALFRLFSGALGNASLSEQYSRATLFADFATGGTGATNVLAPDAAQPFNPDGTVNVTPAEAQAAANHLLGK